MQNDMRQTPLVSWECVKPYEDKEFSIYYHHFHSPFGLCFIAITPRGICKLAFIDTQDEYNKLVQALFKDWNSAHIVENKIKTQPFIKNIFHKENGDKKPIKLLLKGSAFQLKVWEALLTVPEGKLASYQEIAVIINKPKAVRAVASAIAKNQIAYLIPCHRVIKHNGEVGQYRWGKHRKQALITVETSQRDRI